MFGTLLLKEIHETIINLRFMVAALLCIILIPLGFWITMREYDNSVKNYNNARQLYQERFEGMVDYNFQGEAYRPPSPLVMLSSGLEYYLPNKVVTSNDGRVSVLSDTGLDNPVSLLFGKIDFQFIVSMVLSLMALMFMFDCVSGEKEQGTLRMIAANPVPRWQLITAKICGNSLVFLMPFVIALVSVLILVNLSGTISLADYAVLSGLVTGFGVSVLFLMVMFCLGALVSVSMGRPITSLIILLVIWTLFVLVIPKLSPMIAEVVHPIKSQQVWMLERKKAEEALTHERDKRLQELYEQILRTEPEGMLREMIMGGELTDLYDKEKIPIENEYTERITTAVRAIDNEYANERRAQRAIARGISRLSPVSCYAFALSDISGTGLSSIEKWESAAQRFQEQVTLDVYDKYDVAVYTGFGETRIASEVEEGYDPSSAPVPQLNDYRPVQIGTAFETAWIDIVLLALYTVLFFAGAFVKFIRYDVR